LLFLSLFLKQKPMTKKTKITSFFILASFFLLLLPGIKVDASVSEDFEYYQKYQLYPKYEKKQKYSKYKKYSKNKKKYGFADAKEKVAAKDGWTKYKLYKKDPAKYRAYAVYEKEYKKYNKYKKYVTPYSKYSKYKKYKNYDKDSYNSYKNYGSAEYKAGYNRYVAFMNDLDNVTTDTGPEISVGLWSSGNVALEDTSNAFNISADKIFKVTDCASNTIGQVPIGESARIIYVDGSSGTLRVYSSNDVPTFPSTDLSGGKVCFEANDTAESDDIIFDVDKPSSTYDHYRGKIKVQHSYTEDNDTFEGSARRIWVINTLPLEHYLWGYGEMSSGGVPQHAKALIVAARSYARWHIAYGTRWTDEGFNILSTSSSQIYNGYDYEVDHSFIPEAARATNGIVMKYGEGEDIEYVLGAYCSNTDGNTRALAGYPYLVSVPDPYGKVDNPSAGNHMWGMSANGSVVLARDHDWSYTAILSYYYSNISIVKDY